MYLLHMLQTLFLQMHDIKLAISNKYILKTAVHQTVRIH